MVEWKKDVKKLALPAKRIKITNRSLFGSESTNTYCIYMKLFIPIMIIKKCLFTKNIKL